MEMRMKVMMSFVILVVLIFGLYFFTDWFSKVTGYLGGESEIGGLTACLNKGKAEFYYGVYCADCERQREEFGRAMGVLRQVECGTNVKGEILGEKCSNLREIPAWYIGGEIHYGFKNLSELGDISGCRDG